ncbi:MAG: non-homologous end-joining DNA ligase [Bacillota bacterium]
MTERVTFRVGGRTLQFSNPDKLLWANERLRKADLARYFAAVAPFMLPHLRGRPLSLIRFPDGVSGKGFYQKNLPDYAPGWIERFPFPSNEGIIEYMLAVHAADLVWLASQACIEVHAWLATCEDPHHPDIIAFDLDPVEGAGFSECIKAGVLLRRVLSELRLRAFCKTTGGEGLHVYCPVRFSVTHRDAAEFARRVGTILMETEPGFFTLERVRAKRKGRVYVDYLQNGMGRTMRAAYSPRATQGATVSTPLRWSELEHTSPTEHTLATVPARLRNIGDPWRDLHGRGE